VPPIVHPNDDAEPVPLGMGQPPTFVARPWRQPPRGQGHFGKCGGTWAAPYPAPEWPRDHPAPATRDRSARLL